MARVGEKPEPRVVWPWGGPRSVREKLVDRAQFERKTKRKKLGDPKHPSLASHALLEFMGPGHASDELRLPPPPSPFGDGNPEVTLFPDRAFTRQALDRGSEGGGRRGLESALARVSASSDKLERMRAVLQREASMLSLVGRVQTDQDEIIERMKVEYKANGSY